MSLWRCVREKQLLYELYTWWALGRPRLRGQRSDEDLTGLNRERLVSKAVEFSSSRVRFLGAEKVRTPAQVQDHSGGLCILVP